MKHTWIIALIAAALTAAAFGFIFVIARSQMNQSFKKDRHGTFVPRDDVHQIAAPPFGARNDSIIPIDADRFLDLPRFAASAGATSSELQDRPVAGVVNHHVLASDLLARFFKTLKRARPDLERVIILSPDHYKRGVDTITVGTDDFISAGQTIRADAPLADDLVSDRLASQGARELFTGEHGVGALIPFLAREFPDIRVVPIVLRADVPRSRTADLGRRLAKEMDDTTIVIISSDMSHYLSEREALGNDVETLRWLQDRDRPAMARANDDFTDNGPSFVALFAMFEVMGKAPSFTLIDHTISTRYGGSIGSTTSYLNGFWE